MSINITKNNRNFIYIYIRIKNHDLYKIDFNRFNASISSITDIKTCHQSTIICNAISHYIAIMIEID